MADISKIKLPGIDTAYNIKDKGARDLIAALPKSMVFKGTLGTDGTITALPEATAETVGHTYKVITEGTYAGKSAKVGDMFIGAKTGTDVAPTYEWVLVPSGDEPSGTVTNIATGAELTGGPISTTGTISHATSGVTAGTAQGITVNEYGHITAIQDMGYATLASPTFTGNVSMVGATTATAPVIDYSTYDPTTQSTCVVTMDTLMQAIAAISKTDVEDGALVLSAADVVDGTQAQLNSSNTSVEDTQLVIQ